MMTVDTLHDLFIEELEDIYSAERQLLKVLPRMARSAHSVELALALKRYTEQTALHIERVERIFTDLQEAPRGRKCRGMEGLLDEGKERLDRDGDEDVLDAALIAAARRVEHYEIAAYGTAAAHASAVGHAGVAQLLQASLREEQATDRQLALLAAGGLKAMETSSE